MVPLSVALMAYTLGLETRRLLGTLAVSEEHSQYLLYYRLSVFAILSFSGYFRLLNYVFKRGSATANVLGVIAVMYSGFGVLLSYGRGVDDELNTLAAGTTTGLLYKCSCKNCILILSELSL